MCRGWGWGHLGGRQRQAGAGPELIAQLPAPGPGDVAATPLPFCPGLEASVAGAPAPRAVGGNVTGREQSKDASCLLSGHLAPSMPSTEFSCVLTAVRTIVSILQMRGRRPRQVQDMPKTAQPVSSQDGAPGLRLRPYLAKPCTSHPVPASHLCEPLITWSCCLR